MNGDRVVKKLALCGVLSAFALISFMLENLFPPLFIPGGKLGVSNVFILLAGIIAGYKYGIIALAVKCILASAFSGNISAVMYSLPSGFIAFSAQIAIIYYAKKISVVAASAAGGAINSLLQGVTFCIVTATWEYAVYLPYLALIGLSGGIIVGLCVFLAIKFLPEKFLTFDFKVDNYNTKTEDDNE